MSSVQFEQFLDRVNKLDKELQGMSLGDTLASMSKEDRDDSLKRGLSYVSEITNDIDGADRELISDSEADDLLAQLESVQESFRGAIASFERDLKSESDQGNDLGRSEASTESDQGNDLGKPEASTESDQDNGLGKPEASTESDQDNGLGKAEVAAPDALAKGDLDKDDLRNSGQQGAPAGVVTQLAAAVGATAGALVNGLKGLVSKRPEIENHPIGATPKVEFSGLRAAVEAKKAARSDISLDTLAFDARMSTFCQENGISASDFENEVSRPTVSGEFMKDPKVGEFMKDAQEEYKSIREKDGDALDNYAAAVGTVQYAFGEELNAISLAADQGVGEDELNERMSVLQKIADEDLDPEEKEGLEKAMKELAEKIAAMFGFGRTGPSPD